MLAKRIALAVVSALLLTSCTINVNVDTKGLTEEDAIREAGAEWTRFYQAADLEGLMTLYQPDAVVALHGQPALFGLPAIREYFSTRLGGPEAEFELDYEVIRIEDEIAYIISKYWLSIGEGEGEGAVRDAGRSLLVYRRGSDDRWLIEADIDQATPDVVFAD